jgi:hopanoid biosynthesis associated RND transporter like protein HpnN
MRGLRRGAWFILAVALLAAAGAVYFSLHHLGIRTNRSDLVAGDQRLIALDEQLEREFGSRDSLVVVVGNGQPRRLIDFAEALATELRRYPDDFPELFYRLDPERFKHWALLYLEPKELITLKDKLLAQRRVLTSLAADPRLTRFFQAVNEELTRAMIGHLFTDFLDTQPAPQVPDLSLLNASLKELHRHLEGEQSYNSPFNAFFPKEMADLSAEGYFFTDNDKYLLFLVTPREDGYSSTAQCLSLLREVVARVKTRFPEIQVGVTGPGALESDEMSSALKDITLATWLSLLGQMGLLFLFLRSLRRPLVESLVLIIGLCWTFGMVTVAVGHLNLLSLVFAPLMLGLTIDYGVHWFCRLEEEEAEGGRSLNTLACTFRRAAPGIIYAGLAAAVSFLPLVFTGFKGLSELGLIMTLGILIMLAATLILVPTLVLLTEKPQAAEVADDCPGHPRPFLALAWKRPGWIVFIGLVLTALGGLSLFKVSFDLNPLHLQNQRTESVVWEYRLIKESRYSTTYGAMSTASLPELEARIRALKQLPTVSHVESVLSFLPSEVEAKHRLLLELEPILSQLDFPAALPAASTPGELAGVLGRIRFKVAQALESLDPADSPATQEQLQEVNRRLEEIIPLLNPGQHPQAAARLAAFEGHFFTDLKDKWELIKANLHTTLPRLQDLPLGVRHRFISAQGTYLIRIFPSQDIWDFGPLSQFVKDIKSVDPNAVGDPVLLYHFTQGFRNACLWAAGAALLAITLMLLILFKSLKMTLLALLPLGVGTGWTLGLMWLLNIPFNQANVLFLPLILGEGIEFGIIILLRWRMEESARAITLPASTAKGVALAALTTTVGFGSLMVSGHQGVFSLGLLATIGSLSVLLASLSVLPAVLRLVQKNYEDHHLPQGVPTLGPGRWIFHLARKKHHEKTALDD